MELAMTESISVRKGYLLVLAVFLATSTTFIVARFLITASVIGVLVIPTDAYAYKPKKGFVPNEVTAIRIAKAVLMPIYGEENIKRERPFNARLIHGKGGPSSDTWFVNGYLPPHMMGGVAEISISKDTGCILSVSHGQ